ncbi:peptidoglycan-recognition protein LF-like isoform X2 [Pectinophora gossypiella]|uniref:Peptidoglycan recognition protein family domain-containing protein n=1 Tax=Pectinophora gossypiella TaxID=13191 RepID=A0A1E1WHF8_PECGO|nr:peptidoglycan-recognition protein LF-like isoform X2 [Pectinophora gossypiella]
MSTERLLDEDIWSDDSEEEEDNRWRDSRLRIVKRETEVDANQTLLPNGMVNISSVNVTNSSNVRFGPTIVNVTHSENTETVRGFPHSLVFVFKITTTTERISIYFVLLLFTFCISIGIYYNIVVATSYENLDPSPHEWNITRKMWMARDVNNSKPVMMEPLRPVVIQHSVTHECHTFIQCAAAMLEIQKTFITNEHQDTPYNFFIGNDGRVYEGRGWGLQGSHSDQFDPCAVSIGFIGDYREEIKGYTAVSDKQLDTTLKLLQYGVDVGHLHPDYVVFGAKDYKSSASPGSNLYNAIQKWDHYDHKHQYSNLICEQIQFLKNKDELQNGTLEWYVTRNMWGAEPFGGFDSALEYEPLRLVFIQNTGIDGCWDFDACSLTLRTLQASYNHEGENLPYNFIIGKDGRVYESRGWHTDGGRSGPYGLCSISIGFFGEYSNSEYDAHVKTAQINKLGLILEDGVRQGHVDPTYVVVTARDMLAENSPGVSLYNAIQNLQHYSLKYQNMTCDKIYSSHENT